MNFKDFTRVRSHEQTNRPWIPVFHKTDRRKLVLSCRNSQVCQVGNTDGMCEETEDPFNKGMREYGYRKQHNQATGRKL